MCDSKGIEFGSVDSQQTSKNAVLIAYLKDGPWVNYRLAVVQGILFAAGFLGNLGYWLAADMVMRR